MSETHGYTSPSNARRAARQAGYELDQVDIVQDGARFFYQPKSGAVVTEGAEHSEVVAEGQAVAETGGVTDPDDEIAGDADHVLPTVAAPVLTGLDRLHELDGNSVVMLIGIDGADYGMAKVCEVVNTAANLAGSEGIAIKIVDPTDGDTMHIVMPEGVEAEAAAAAGNQTDAEAGTEAPVAAKVDEPQTIAMLFERVEGERNITLQERSAEGLVLMVNGEVVYRQHRTVRSTAKADKPAREPKAPKTEPEGKYKLIVDLCCRETGASPQELHEATGWTGAPWKWLLTNPKNTGLAQKYGYDFVASKDGRNVRYMLVKQEAQQAEAA
jgi:hypothetical protein